jgi:hypothetical protein
MGEKLLRYYKYVGEVNGTVSKMQLAIETKVPSIKAATEPDTPELIAAFQRAVAKITGKPAPQL